MPPSLPAPRTASFLSESLRVMVETFCLVTAKRSRFPTRGRGSMFRPSGERWWVTGGRRRVARCRWRVTGGRFAREGRPSCGRQAEKLLVRHANTTPLHLRCDRKSAEALESKGVVERPLRKRVCKMKKEKGIDEKRASW